ncbi:hypothetical protein Nepgr_009424 [Nepenthes gracilis]|uniref:Uncharacterized protein n=1 Tax=Nepenthes gracilis TaxID=150966 RepID=A0AAD3SBF6_NEPGR|nr:hypothetical protein Nepgr_009424 [Nepenthes gracilis]
MLTGQDNCQESAIWLSVLSPEESIIRQPSSDNVESGVQKVLLVPMVERGSWQLVVAVTMMLMASIMVLVGSV